jgi:hypothetical protein
MLSRAWTAGCGERAVGRHRVPAGDARRVGGGGGAPRASCLGPVGNATVEAFWRRPEWTDRPQGYDIPARAGWYPIVTGLQEVADLIAAFGATSGYGHNYGIDFVIGWAAVAPGRMDRRRQRPAPAAPPDRVGPRGPTGTVRVSLSPRVNSLVGCRR